MWKCYGFINVYFVKHNKIHCNTATKRHFLHMFSGKRIPFYPQWYYINWLLFLQILWKKKFSKYISLFLALKTEKRDLNLFRRPCIVFLWRRDTIRCQKRYFREQRTFYYASMQSISGTLWYRIFQSCSLRKEKEWCYKIL